MVGGGGFAFERWMSGSIGIRPAIENAQETA